MYMSVYLPIFITVHNSKLTTLSDILSLTYQQECKYYNNAKLKIQVNFYRANDILPADDILKFFCFVFLVFLKNVSLGDSLHEMLKPIFREN